jgi:hypothetical protein
MDTHEFIRRTAESVAMSIEEAWQEEWGEQGSDPAKYDAGLAEFTRVVLSRVTQLPASA